MNEHVLLDIFTQLKALNSKIDMMIPKEATISFLAERKGVSRQAVHDYIKKHFEPEVDYKRKNGKIVVLKDAVIKYLIG